MVQHDSTTTTSMPTQSNYSRVLKRLYIQHKYLMVKKKCLKLKVSPGVKSFVRLWTLAFTNGAKQLVVHEALEMMLSECLYWSALTPTTYVGTSLPLAGAVIRTFLAPACKLQKTSQLRQPNLPPRSGRRTNSHLPDRDQPPCFGCPCLPIRNQEKEARAKKAHVRPDTTHRGRGGGRLLTCRILHISRAKRIGPNHSTKKTSALIALRMAKILLWPSAKLNYHTAS
jgi:hypothetical protein